MNYFNSKEIAAISISATLWAVLNWLVSPVFWQLTHLPILCDMIVVTVLIVTLWWTRKPGAGAFMGLTATALNLFLRPGAFHFFGFTVACIFFDIALRLIGYSNMLDKGLRSHVSLVALSVASTTMAGFLIGSFFMNPVFIANAFGGIIFFAAIHGGGGLVGGVFGIVMIKGLERRQVVPMEGWAS